jgi:hypothetical protein
LQALQPDSAHRNVATNPTSTTTYIYSKVFVKKKQRLWIEEFKNLFSQKRRKGTGIEFRITTKKRGNLIRLSG